MSTKNLLTAGLAAAFVMPAAALPFQFDIDDDVQSPGNTQSGFASLSDIGDGVIDGNLQGTDDGVTVVVTGFPNGTGRDRGLGGSQGVDNDNNQVPEGTFSDLYRDFHFANPNQTVTVSLSGLEADTSYLVTAFSYDSGAFNGTAVQQDFLVGSTVVAELDYEGDVSFGPGPDPNTDLLTDYSVTFEITTDGSGNAVFTTLSDGTQGARLNGLIVDIPEPSSLALMGLGGLLIARRRRG
ncbi:MAG: PEP-CTERM sorting domain-containing protein [Planctomycetota bacterium]